MATIVAHLRVAGKPRVRERFGTESDRPKTGGTFANDCVLGPRRRTKGAHVPLKLIDEGPHLVRVEALVEQRVETCTGLLRTTSELAHASPQVRPQFDQMS